MAKTFIGYAPMLNGKLLIDEIVSYKAMRTTRCRSKVVTKTGRVTSKWGPETSWSEMWKNEGATIVRVRITPETLHTEVDIDKARRKLAAQARAMEF